MRRRGIFLAILMGIPLCAGCASLAPQQYGYRFRLLGDQVQRPGNAGAVQLSVTPTATAIALIVENQSDESVRVLWDRCVYVDTDNVSHRLIHSGVLLLTKEQAQTPTTVAAKSRLEDTLTPSDYVQWNGSAWETRSLFPRYEEPGPWGTGFQYMAWAEDGSIHEHPNTFRGKEFSVVVVVEINAKPVEKTFKFTVAEVIGPPTRKK